MIIGCSYLSNGRTSPTGERAQLAKIEIALLEMRKRISIANKLGLFTLEGDDRKLSQKAAIICDLHADAEAALDLLVKKMFILTNRSFGMKVMTETLCGQYEYALMFKPTRLMMAYGPRFMPWTENEEPIENAARFATMCGAISGEKGFTVDKKVMQSVFSVGAMKMLSESRRQRTTGGDEQAKSTMFIAGRHTALRNAMVRHSAHIAPKTYTKDGLIAMAVSNCDEIQMLGERVLDEWVVGTALDVYITNLVAQAGIMTSHLGRYMYAVLGKIWKIMEARHRLTQKNAFAMDFQTYAFGTGIYVHRGFPSVRAVKLEDIGEHNVAAVNSVNATALNAITMTPVRYQMRVKPEILPTQMVGLVDSELAFAGRKAFLEARMDGGIRVSSKLPLVKPRQEAVIAAPKATVPMFK
jgi:hypothetical protein